MILNRQKLRKHIEDENTITFIMKKANKFGIAFDSMMTGDNGRIFPTRNFVLSEWINKHEKFMKTLRVDWVYYNMDVLKIVKGIR